MACCATSRRRDSTAPPASSASMTTGREILTFIAGEVGAYPLPASMWSDEALAGAAQLLRRLHDATLGYVAPARSGLAVCLP